MQNKTSLAFHPSPRKTLLPALACNRSQPRRGPLQRTASCATDITEDNALFYVPPLRSFSLIQ